MTKVGVVLDPCESNFASEKDFKIVLIRIASWICIRIVYTANVIIAILAIKGSTPMSFYFDFRRFTLKTTNVYDRSR